MMISYEVPRISISALKGKTITKIEGAYIGSEQIKFITKEGPINHYYMFHDQD
jgi:hypothetical protein